MSALQRLRLFAAVRRFGSLMLFWPLWREPGLRLSPGVRWPRGGPSAPPEHVVRYRETNAARLIRDLAPDGIDLVVEVAAGANAALDLAVLKPHGTIAIYANDGGARLNVDIGTSMGAERAVISSFCSTPLAGNASAPPPRTSTTRSQTAPSMSAPTPAYRSITWRSRTRQLRTGPSKTGSPAKP